MNKELQCILAGFGGQGVLFAGKVIAYAGLIEDKHVSWLPSYGPEMRGGTANCSVTISDIEIGSPLITTPNALVAMNQPSYDKFKDSVSEGGVIVLESELVSNYEDIEGVSTIAIPASKIAQDNELSGLLNIVLLGKLWSVTKFCERNTLDEAIKKCVPASKAHLLDKNLKAIELGICA